MEQSNIQPKAWTKPQVQLIGKIADVALQNQGPNQCGAVGGGCTPKS